MEGQKEIRIITWIELLQSRGAFAFSIESAKNELPAYSEIALKRALSRLSEKGKIISVYKGYYLILPPQYALKGILPPSLFLDAFFQFLERPYYVSLLNAAAYHGASHQQPQEYYVMTNFPAMRATQKKGLKINYVSIDKIPEKLLEKRKTEAGYLTISNPVLTATDLVQFERRIGGLNRAATVLFELMEVLKPSDFNEDILAHAAVTTLQRLGYLLEFACSNTELSNALYKAMEKNKSRLFRIPLKASAQTKGFSSDNRWKVIVNTEIDIDL
ncbi:MAG: type IV toxin-antitoxin system AbiEi family antitoxin [Bacteroidales bacterium]